MAKKKIDDQIQTLLANYFELNDEEQELITQGLESKAPKHVSEFLKKLEGFDRDIPYFTIHENHIKPTAHPINLLLLYLDKMYGKKIAFLYGSALDMAKKKEYLEYLEYVIASPYGRHIRDGKDLPNPLI